MWSFLARLKERKLAQWAIAYLAGAWLVLQVLGLVAQPFAWPALVLKAVTVLLAIGLLAVLVIAWYHGERGAQKVSGIELLMLTGILAIAAAAVALVSRGGRDGDAESADAASPERSVPSATRTAIAVLPFENLSEQGPFSYFAGGLHDELLTQLSRVASLRVISRTSVMGYAGSEKNIREIAKELAAGSIVEGSVQVAGQRLRVNVQLIDAATDEHVWAERYDRTLDDAFAVQSEIAQQIVSAVGARLAAPERTAISAAPTANAEAYRLYLQGQDYWRRPGRNRRDFEIAQGLYEQAVALDPDFALAHAALSQVHGMLQWFRYDPSPERLVQQRREAETALRLAPELPQAHRAMAAWRYFGERNWQAALAEYRVAAEGLPGDAETWEYMGYAQRRLGNWQEVFDVLKRVIALDPRNANALYDLGGFTSVHIRRYQDALDWYGRALALAPDALSILLNRAVVPLLWQGSLDSLDAVLQRIPAGTDLGEGEGTSTAWKAKVLLWERRPEQLLALVNGQGVFEAYEFYLPATLYQGWAQQLLGNRPAARAAFESARARLDSALTVLPDDWRVHAARGLALAGLGRTSAAEGEARWLQQSDVYRADAYLRPYLAEDRALILAGCGQGAAAVTEIEHVLAGPSSTVSVYTLRLDPRLDPIRNRPDFQALLRRYARPAPVR